MGKIPPAKNMISAIITNPLPDDRLAANTTFEVLIQTRNLHSGVQTNPAVSYFTAPQDIDEDGYVLGHCHVVIEELGSLRTLIAPDTLEVCLFPGHQRCGRRRAASDGSHWRAADGPLSRLHHVAAGNHQPVVTPLAQRGGQNDCARFAVVESAEDDGYGR